MAIGEDFNKSVEYFDSWIKIALPDYDEFFRTALKLIPFKRDISIKALDLGAGTGLFTKFIADLFPSGSFVLYDTADKMIDMARKRFSSNAASFHFIVDDYCNITTTEKFNLVISSLSIHHLEHVEKQKLLYKIYEMLEHGGIFINIDQVKAPSEVLEELYTNIWKEWVTHKGGTAEQLEASIKRRTLYDKEALLTDQIKWLNEAGFADVDCVFKNYFAGVFYCVKR